MNLEPCADCGADAAKPRVGSLGEQRGVWCTQCGSKANSVDAWNEGSRRRVWRGSSKPSFTYPVVDAACDIHTLTGDDLDQYAYKAYGLIRDVLPSGRLETDDEFRARALASGGPPPWRDR